MNIEKIENKVKEILGSNKYCYDFASEFWTDEDNVLLSDIVRETVREVTKQH